VISLAPPTHLPLRIALKRRGAAVIPEAGPEALHEAVASADATLVHYWSTPELWQALSALRAPTRLVLWSKIEGSHPPQRIAPALFRDAAGVALTAPPPEALAGALAGALDAPLAEAAIVPGLMEVERLAGLERKPHPGFRVDYIGSLSRGKLNPCLFDAIDGLAIRDLAVRIVGGRLDPAFERRLAASPRAGQIACPGFTERIGLILETTDVFAYPLSETTYASSDKSLQEAMCAGVPPVILPHGGPRRFVEDGVTGLVAADPESFGAPIERLYRDPALRARLGAAAREMARSAFDPRPHAERLLRLIEAALQVPKAPVLAGGPDLSPAGLFLVSQGLSVETAREMARDWETGSMAAALARIEGAPDDLFEVEGGILQWRNAMPGDPILAEWSRAWLAGRGAAG
jgi:glycosyltransferase involved in cell wall biosynthesis